MCAGKASGCYGQLCRPRCLETPLAQKMGGAKHICEVVYTEPDRFFQGRAHAQPKTVWFTRTQRTGRYHVYSFAEPRLLALIWPEAKARVPLSPGPFSRVGVKPGLWTLDWTAGLDHWTGPLDRLTVSRMRRA